MDSGNIKLLITAFVCLLVGVSLLTIIAGEANDVRETINIRNETLNVASFRNASGIDGNNCNDTVTPVQITNYPSGWRTNSEYGCHIASFVMHQSNGTSWTNGTEFQFFPNNGTWKCLINAGFNNTDTTNMTALNYTYCPDDYLTQAWSRTMLGIVPGFFAIALIAVGIGLFYVILRKEGLMHI